MVHYYNTIGVHSTRRIVPHLLWTIAQFSGTCGCFVLFGLIAQVYATLLATGQSVAAILFLPFGTAFTETGMVVFTRLMYNRLVHSNKTDPETAPLVGDQLYIPAPCLIMSAHAFAEGCRLTATFSGVISGGGWGWISTSVLSIMLNLSARLGWTRFMLIQLGKKMCSGPKAMALFGPTGWSKYHDELKIYAGYFRFVSIIALCVARLISYGVFEVEGPKAPAFNLSALLVIISLLAGEFIEDQIVTNELLPVNPAGPGLLKMNANGDNADPAQLISLEHLPNVQQGDPWRMSELEMSGKLSVRRTSSLDSASLAKGITATPSLVVHSASAITPTFVPQKVVSLGSSETDRWSRLRKRFGQPRSLNSSAALHGLRELPFAVQLSFVGIVSEFTLGLLALLVGAGYLRGTCENVLVGTDRIVGLDLENCGLQQREQAIAEGAWRSQEKDLERRISLLEALLRQRSGLDGAGSNAAAPEVGGSSFAENFQGPFVRRGQAFEDGIYFSRSEAAKPATAPDERPLSRLLVGDFEALGKYLGL
eukprot:s424_g20.t1